MLLKRGAKNKFWDMMIIKLLAEIDCKEYAVRNGIEIFVSVDLDEYLMPSKDDQTVVDELAAWFNYTTRGMISISKVS
jgi:hypothetical protein